MFNLCSKCGSLIKRLDTLERESTCVTCGKVTYFEITRPKAISKMVAEHSAKNEDLTTTKYRRLSSIESRAIYNDFSNGMSVGNIMKKYDLTHRSCLLYTSPSPRDGLLSRMPSSA